MNPIERLRLKTNPKPGKPPAGHVDFIYSETMGGMAVRDSDGNDTLVAGGVATGRQVVALSSQRIDSDTDLTLTGSTVGADQTSRIQDVLDLALEAPLTVLWDAAVTAAGLIVHPNTRIVVSAGCGAKLKNSANNALLSNANYRAGASQANWTTAPNYSLITKDANIQIVGGIWNGNGANQAHDSVAEGWHVCLRFFNVENLLLDNISIFNPRTFSAHFCNANNFIVRDSFIDCGASSVVNRDGWHLNGNCTNFHLLNNTVRSWDDAVGLNADDLEVQISPAAPSVFGPYASFGPITNGVIDGLHLTGGRYGVRMLSGLSSVTGIDVRNITGAAGGHAILIDNYTESTASLRNAGPGNFGRINIDGINLSLTSPSAYKQAGVFVSATIASLTMRNTVFSFDESNVDIPPIRFGTTGTGVVCAVTDLTIENCKVLGPTDESVTPLQYTFLVTGNATITKATLRDITRRRRSAKTQPYGALVTMGGTAVITSLLLDGVDAPLVAGDVNLTSSGAITNLDVRNSNIFKVVRGNDLANLITRDGRDADQYYITATDNEGSIHGIYGGGGMTQTDTVFSCIVKLPATFAGSTSVSIGSRTIDWRVGSNACDGYTIDITSTDVYLGKITTGFSFTSLVQRTVGLTVSTEYYLELRCVGTTISAYVQRLADNLWLNTSATFQADRVAFASVTDSTYTGKWSHVKMYPGTSGGSKTVRFRELKHRPA